MEDDLVTSLTRQVKEEVVENYVLERRLIELQIEHLRSQAREAQSLAWETGKRLRRLIYLALRPEAAARLLDMLGVSRGGCFWNDCLTEQFPTKIARIEVRSLTLKGKFRKLFLESYSRLYERMAEYGRHYDDLAEECCAVNSNIATFGRNFDLLAILNFLRSLDMQALERKKILGENFTAREMAELDKSLYIRPIALEKLGAPAPLRLPSPRSIEPMLSDLAKEIYERCGNEVKKILD